MRVRSEIPFMKAIGRSAAWVALLFTLGCAPTARQAINAQSPPNESANPPAGLASAGDEAEITATPVLLSEEVRADYEAAVGMLEEEQYGPGIGLLIQVIDRAPALTAARVDLGIAYSRTGDFQSAEASLNAALDLNPHHPVAHNELGLIQRQKGNFAEARMSYEAALVAHPEFHHAHKNLGILCDIYLGDYACALEHYEAYTALVPGDAAVVKWIADVRQRGNLPPNTGIH